LLALGKAGAAIGTFVFPLLAEASSYAVVMAVCVAIVIAGALLTEYCIDATIVDSRTSTAFQKAKKGIENFLETHFACKTSQ